MLVGLANVNIASAQTSDLEEKARAAGMSSDQIRQAAAAQGVSDTSKSKEAISPSGTTTTNTSDNREVIGDEKINNKPALIITTADGVPIFGSELFNNKSLKFEPNLRIATPQNYRLGPNDQVIINVYGNSQIDWKLSVSPDGNIQIPGIGLLNISGKTIEQATLLIKSKLIANHYAIGHGTDVAVTLGNIRSVKVILVGEIVKPGTYTLSSLSTVFNALYASGGPNINGSFRQIEIIRDNRVINKLDIYDFLLRGDQKNNIRLQDGDIIRVPTYKVRVSLSGEVKRPAAYEVLAGETLKNVIDFSGGFTDIAYTGDIKVSQLTDNERRITDIYSDDYKNYIPLRGDKYTVGPILDRYENRVTINGSVFRPGVFELEKGLTLSKLIAKAAGLKEDASPSRGYITRLQPDNTTMLVPFNVKGIVSGTDPDILLHREDAVIIPSIFDLRDQYKVTINGGVRKGGEFAYADSMSVEDLIVQAGGFTEDANTKRIEVARRINNSDPMKKNTQIAQVFTINVDAQLKLQGPSFVLKPFDIVSVYSLSGYEKQKTVKIEGEVLYPGSYTIKTKDEKISDLIKRAGGLTASAYIEGGTLKRTNDMGLDIGKGKVNVTELQQERAQRFKQIQKVFKDTTSSEERVQYTNEFVGIDLKEIINKPGSKQDLILEEGDILRIPQQQQTVKVNGEVLFGSSVVYSSSKTFKGYINNAGGFSPYALKSRSYVVYPNGTVKGTHNYVFFNSYPSVRPGSQLFVPKKPVKKSASLTDIVGISTGLASLAAVFLAIITLRK